MDDPSQAKVTPGWLHLGRLECSQRVNNNNNNTINTISLPQLACDKKCGIMLSLSHTETQGQPSVDLPMECDECFSFEDRFILVQWLTGRQRPEETTETLNVA